MKNCRILYKWKLDNRKYFTYDNARKIINENIKNWFWKYEDYSIREYN